jgi:hypothetical protein
MVEIRGISAGIDGGSVEMHGGSHCMDESRVERRGDCDSASDSSYAACLRFIGMHDCCDGGPDEQVIPRDECTGTRASFVAAHEQTIGNRASFDLTHDRSRAMRDAFATTQGRREQAHDRCGSSDSPTPRERLAVPSR